MELDHDRVNKHAFSYRFLYFFCLDGVGSLSYSNSELIPKFESFRQSVKLLEPVISLATKQTQKKRRHAYLEWDPNLRSQCLSSHGHCDRPPFLFDAP
jgi:hypothetical protein